MWGKAEKDNWFKQQTIKRSYQTEVVAKITKLEGILDISTYGALSYDPARYPLYMIKTKNFDSNKNFIFQYFYTTGLS